MPVIGVQKMQLSKFMLENKCIGLSEIDTRAVVNILRSEGSLKSVIASKSVLPIKDAGSELKKFGGTWWTRPCKGGFYKRFL